MAMRRRPHQSIRRRLCPIRDFCCTMRPKGKGVTSRISEIMGKQRQKLSYRETLSLRSLRDNFALTIKAASVASFFGSIRPRR